MRCCYTGMLEQPGLQHGLGHGATRRRRKVGGWRGKAVSSHNSVRVTARNVSTSTVDLPAAPLMVQVMMRRVP